MVNAKVIKITPAMASNWMSYNTGNRTIKPDRVKYYAEQMRKGQWRLNGEPIIFSQNGLLKDGQHRLMAIIKSGTPIEALCVFGVDDDLFVFDRNAGRSVSDNLCMSGLPKWLSSNANVAVVVLYYFEKTKQNHLTVNEETSRSFLIRFINEFQETENICKFGSAEKGTINTRCAYMKLATLLALLNGISPSILADFFRIVRTGKYDEKWQTSAVVFRNDILFKGLGRTHDDRLHAMYATEKAISDYNNRNPRLKTYSIITEPTFSRRIIDEWYNNENSMLKEKSLLNYMGVSK